MKRLFLPFFILFCLYMWSSRLGTDGYELEFLLSADNIVHNGSFYMATNPPSVPGIFDRLPGQPMLPRHNLLQVILAVPFYIAGMPFNSLYHGADSGITALPLGSLAMISFLNPLLTLFSIWVLIRISRQLGASEQAAILCGMVYGAATIAWPYAAIGMEPLQTTCLLLCLSVFIQFRKNPTLSLTWILALSLTALMHTKISAPLLALPISITALYYVFKVKSQRTRKLIVYIGILTLSSIIWMFLYYLRSKLFYSSGFFKNFNPGLIPRNTLGFLISPGKSLIPYSPILLWCIPAIAGFIRKNRVLAGLMGIIALLTMLLTACWDWSLIEECWGPRYLMPIIPLFFIAGNKQFEINYIKPKKYLFIFLLIISVLVQIPGLIYPNVCLLQYVHSDSVPVVDLTTWAPDLSPIRIGWHMIANKLRESIGISMKPYKWCYYRGIVGWGSSLQTEQFSDHHWNRPYAAPFLFARLLQSKPENAGLEYPDPGWLFVLWLSVVIAIFCLLTIWYLRLTKTLSVS